MKKIVKILCLMVCITLVSGCSLFEEKKNVDGEIYKAKEAYIKDLKNYSYTGKITTKTGIADVDSEITGREDLVHKTAYITSTTLVVKTQSYYDYEKGKEYTALENPLEEDTGWVTNNIKTNNDNSWLNITDYIFDLKEENVEVGMKYTGVISSKKLSSALSQTDSKSKAGSIFDKDIPIEVILNNDGYISNMKFSLSVIGIEEEVELNFFDYNTSEDVIIPDEVK